MLSAKIAPVHCWLHNICPLARQSRHGKGRWPSRGSQMPSPVLGCTQGWTFVFRRFSSNKFISHLWHRSSRVFFFSLIFSALKRESKHFKRLKNETTCRRNSSKPSAEPARSQQQDLYQRPKKLCKKKDKICFRRWRKKSNWNDLDCATRPCLSLANFDWPTMMVDLAIVVIPVSYKLYSSN